jgi:hypothetical protein
MSGSEWVHDWMTSAQNRTCLRNCAFCNTMPAYAVAGHSRHAPVLSVCALVSHLVAIFVLPGHLALFGLLPDILYIR